MFESNCSNFDIYFQESTHADSFDNTRVVATPEQTPDVSTNSHSIQMNTPDKTLSELQEQSINETVESQPLSVEEEPTGTIQIAPSLKNMNELITF